MCVCMLLYVHIDYNTNKYGILCECNIITNIYMHNLTSPNYDNLIIIHI